MGYPSASPGSLRLTRSGAVCGQVVLKQASDITEWWEPLLQPFVHYVPVASTLANLSDAVLWVRAHQDAARAIARDAGALLEARVHTMPHLG